MSELNNQWNTVSRLIEQLGSASHTPEEIIGLIEATGNSEQTIKLLALSSDWESICATISLAYTVLGRCKEAVFVFETILSIYPENAYCHLALGKLFWGALYNANPPPKDSISFLRKTIESTGQAGKDTLNTIKKEDPYLYRALTDREYEKNTDEYEGLFSRVTLEALGCSWDYAYKKAEEQFIEAMRLSKDEKNREQAKRDIATLRMTKKAEKDD